MGIFPVSIIGSLIALKAVVSKTGATYHLHSQFIQTHYSMEER
jgi:hypothetical protein